MSYIPPTEYPSTNIFDPKLPPGAHAFAHPLPANSTPLFISPFFWSSPITTFPRTVPVADCDLDIDEIMRLGRETLSGPDPQTLPTIVEESEEEVESEDECSSTDSEYQNKAEPTDNQPALDLLSELADMATSDTVQISKLRRKLTDSKFTQFSFPEANGLIDRILTSVADRCEETQYLCAQIRDLFHAVALERSLRPEGPTASRLDQLLAVRLIACRQTLTSRNKNPDYSLLARSFFLWFSEDLISSRKVGNAKVARQLQEFSSWMKNVRQDRTRLIPLIQNILIYRSLNFKNQGPLMRRVLASPAASKHRAWFIKEAFSAALAHEVPSSKEKDYLRYLLICLGELQPLADSEPGRSTVLQALGQVALQVEERLKIHQFNISKTIRSKKKWATIARGISLLDK